MQIKMFEFNRYRETIEVFEARVRAFVSTAPSVSRLEVLSLSNPDLLVTLVVGDAPAPGQDFCIFTGVDLDEVEELANNTLEALSRTAKIAKHVSVLPLKSPRAVLAMIVQQRGNESNGSNGEESGQGSAPEPNKAADAGADASPKRRQRGGNRKAITDGA